VRSALVRLDDFDAQGLNAILAEMREEALGFVRQGGDIGTPDIECTAYMRYVGQGWDIPVTIEQDSFAPGDEAVTTFALLGVQNWLLTWYRPDGRLAIGPLADRFADLFLDGLRPRSSEGR